MGEGPVHCWWCHPWAGTPGFYNAEQAMMGKPVSRSLSWPLYQLLPPGSCPFLFLFLQWWTVIQKCKANKNFPLQVALITVFHHSNSSPNQDISLEFPLHSTIYPNAESLYQHLGGSHLRNLRPVLTPYPCSQHAFLPLLIFHLKAHVSCPEWSLTSSLTSTQICDSLCLLPPLSLIDKTLPGSTPCSSYQNYSITYKLVLVSCISL